MRSFKTDTVLRSSNNQIHSTLPDFTSDALRVESLSYFHHVGYFMWFQPRMHCGEAVDCSQLDKSQVIFLKHLDGGSQHYLAYISVLLFLCI